MKTCKSKSGFSLIELLLAAVATAILALTVGSLLYFGWLGWHRDNASVDMQRDTSLAMRTMEREIHGATSLEVPSASTLDCTNPSNTVRFVKSGADLDMEVDGTFEMHLIRGVVDSFSPTVDAVNGSVKIQLQLAAGNDPSSVEETIYTRNAP